MTTIKAINGIIDVIPTKDGDVQLGVSAGFMFSTVLLSPEQCRMLADLLVNSGRGNSWDSVTEVSGAKKTPPKATEDIVGPV
jgi:uncharacterized metal-binding protein